MNWRVRLAVWILGACAIDSTKGEPIVFADPQTVDFEALPKDLPFQIIPARTKAGHSMEDSFFVVRLPERAQ